MTRAQATIALIDSETFLRSLDGGASTAVIPFGSVESHGGHLPLGADAILADEVGARVGSYYEAIVVPTVDVGCSEQHAHLPGTLTLRPETLTAIAVDYVGCLARQGFGLIVLVTAHGGNQAALEAAVTHLQAELPATTVCAPRGDVGPDPGSYSGVWLTSVMLALRPDLVDLSRTAPELAEEIATASPARGRQELDRFVSGIIREIQTLAPSKPESRPPGSAPGS